MATCLDCPREMRDKTNKRCWTCHTARLAASRTGDGRAASAQAAYRARKAAGVPSAKSPGRPRTYPRCPVCPEAGRCNACRRARYQKVPRVVIPKGLREPRVRTVQVSTVIKPARRVDSPFERSETKACPTCMTRHREVTEYCKRHS